MKILKRIGIVLGILVFLWLVVSAFLPGTVVFSRSRVMPVSKETAFEKINVLQQWPKWMTWAKLDPNAVYTYSAEPAAGKGAWYTWKGNKDMGEGKMVITEVFGTDSIYMDLIFADYPPNPVAFKLFEKDKGTEVVWSMKMEFPFMMRIMGLFMEGMMGPDFEGGLEGIEKLALAEPAKAASTANYTVAESAEMMCLTMTDSCAVDQIGMKYGTIYGDIQKEMKAQKVDQAGAPFAVTIRFDENKGFYVFSAGIPVTAEVKKTKNPKITYGKYNAQKSLIYDYYGAYEKMQPTYEAMYNYLGENKMEPAGYSWEEYLTDPMTEKDTAKWQTRIYMPIK
ncbi:MAG: transcriptional regulator, effector-binding domain/component [Bacteroidetes bacterium]|jgi:effector-binding domain-containing protein|nr:transcriptional regulator, effector-binding domain/component [Bacteroidota bacterium]